MGRASSQRRGLSVQITQALQELLAEDDAVVMAQGLEPVGRRAAQDWHIGCSFGVRGQDDALVGNEALAIPWQT